MRSWTPSDYDQYLLGLMDPDQKQRFETDLKSDQALSDSFADYRQTVELIRLSFNRRKLKSKLQRLHGEIFNESSRKKSKRRTIFLFAGNIAAAASIAAIITFGILLLTDMLGLDRKGAYMELRNEVQDIYSEQESIKRELKKSKQIPVIFTGTSFAISSDGLLATNYHVIRGLDSVWVSNYTDSLVRYTAAIVYRNAEQDIALLRIMDPNFKGFGRLPYSIPGKGAEMGEYVYTLGYSKQDIVFGEGSISSVSGYNSDTTAYQISIPVNPGNSGGPLFDNHGNLLGMISGKNTLREGVGFALKSEYIFAALEEIKDKYPDSPPQMVFKNQISGKKRPDQLKTLQPLVFRVQINR